MKMTNEEAIKNIVAYMYYAVEDIPEEVRKAFDKAVEALKNERPQGEYVDISKLRLMTVEECAGHTIDYAMGWKACIEWIKKGCAE